jgi:hypothetical protein
MAVKSEETFFNFPIHLLKGFMNNSTNCLNEIMFYGVYTYSFVLTNATEEEKIKSSLKYFCLTSDDQVIKKVIREGSLLWTNTPQNSVMVGINRNMLFDFRDNYKTDLEKLCLLSFLAIRSIIQNKAYCKIDNNFLWSRMDGNSKSCDPSELSEDFKKYTNRYQTDKFKTELIFNWNLIYYSRHTRGFYVSFKLSLDELVFEAEKRRKSYKEKLQKTAQNDALKKALDRLSNSSP